MSRHFEHEVRIWADFRNLVPGVIFVEGITPAPDTSARTAALGGVATGPLAVSTEGQFPTSPNGERPAQQPSGGRWAADTLPQGNDQRTPSWAVSSRPTIVTWGSLYGTRGRDKIALREPRHFRW